MAKHHAVREGESTSTIAVLHGIPVEQLVAWNPQKHTVVALVGGRRARVFASLLPGEQLAVDCGCSG